MTEALVTRDSAAMTKNDLVAWKRLVAEAMAAVMKPNVHYGTLPGTPKPSLWEPGADALLVTFRLACHFKVEDYSTSDRAQYRVTAEIRRIGDEALIGVGVGEASSDEEKYRWRRAVCDEEWNETPETHRRKKWAKGKDKPYTVAQVRTVPADVANTVLKMAAKRAKVGATRTAVGASDIFSQDLEDLPEGLELNETPVRTVQAPKAKAPAPQQSAPPPQDEPPIESYDAPQTAEIDPAEVLWHDILRRVGGDENAAHQVLREITSYPAGKKKDGSEYRAFAGCKDWQGLDNAQRVAKAKDRLSKHPQFGDRQREPGED